MEGGTLADDRRRWWFRAGRPLNDDVAPPKVKNARVCVGGCRVPCCGVHGRAGGLDGAGLGRTARLLIGPGGERWALRERPFEWRFRCEMVEVSWPVVPRHGYDWRLAMWAARGWKRRRAQAAILEKSWAISTLVLGYSVRGATRHEMVCIRCEGRRACSTRDREGPEVGTLDKDADRRMGVVGGRSASASLWTEQSGH